ncbi:hypothetical protein FDUTEX481_06978 [Tolypothrix sp. PCC 7601]|nr:hypothetical protein FDUTEX481_06978 [Tolypothrix sp. PCC 7601]
MNHSRIIAVPNRSNFYETLHYYCAKKAEFLAISQVTGRGRGKRSREQRGKQKNIISCKLDNLFSGSL